MDTPGGDADRFVECVNVLSPLFECALPFGSAYKILNFHLLEFARAKNEIPRSNLVAESLPYLRDAERQFGMQGVDDVLEIDEYAAGGLRPEVRIGRFSRRANRRHEHRVEHFSVLKRVGKSRHVAARLPRLRVHHDGRIESAHIVAVLDKHPPPELLYIVLELDAERSVVPKTGKSSVNLRAGVDEAASLGERNYLFHRYVGHALTLSQSRWRM